MLISKSKQSNSISVRSIKSQQLRNMMAQSRELLVTLLVVMIISFESARAQDRQWSDEDVLSDLMLVEKDLSQTEVYKYATRLTQILHDLNTIKPASIKGLNREQLVEILPDLASTADFLMTPDQRKTTIIMQDLFQIITSNCKSEVQAMEKILKKLTTGKTELPTLESIFHTYEIDCIYNASL